MTSRMAVLTRFSLSVLEALGMALMACSIPVVVAELKLPALSSPATRVTNAEELPATASSAE